MKKFIFISSRSTQGAPIVYRSGKWNFYNGDLEDFINIEVMPLVDEGETVLRRKGGRFFSLKEVFETMAKENAIACEILPDEYSSGEENDKNLRKFADKFELPEEWFEDEKHILELLSPVRWGYETLR